jgi:hypothetical protein
MNKDGRTIKNANKMIQFVFISFITKDMVLAETLKFARGAESVLNITAVNIITSVRDAIQFKALLRVYSGKENLCC